MAKVSRQTQRKKSNGFHEEETHREKQLKTNILALRNPASNNALIRLATGVYQLVQKVKAAAAQELEPKTHGNKSTGLDMFHTANIKKHKRE